jgi:hypothetical protein
MDTRKRGAWVPEKFAASVPEKNCGLEKDDYGNLSAVTYYLTLFFNHEDLTNGSCIGY